MSKVSNSPVSIDQMGRVRPSPNIKALAHTTSRNYFRFPEEQVDLSESHKLLLRSFPNVVKAEIFNEKILALYKKARNLLKFPPTVPLVYAPIFMPRLQHDDIAVELENVYFPAINAAYKAVFPDYDFTVEYKDSLGGKIQSIEGLGHDRLEEMARKSDIIGITMFVLREYSVQAAREQMLNMPTDFALAGILDVSAALVSRPGLMFNTVQYAPMVWASGCETPWEHANFHYEGYGYNLMFNRRVHHELVAEYWSHGISLFEGV